MALPLLAYGAMAAFQIYSGAQSANAIQRQAEISRLLEEFNIEQAQLDAFNAERDGYSEQARYQNVIDEVEASSRVRYLAADIDPNFGTAAELQGENKLNGALNLMDIASKAHQRAMGYEMEAIQRRGQSTLNMMSAKSQAEGVRTASYINAANTAITGYERNAAPSSGGGSQKTSGKTGHFSVNYVNEDAYNLQYGGQLGRIG